MGDFVSRLLEKVQRDRAQGLTTLAKKSLRYARELATAPVYLAAATKVG